MNKPAFENVNALQSRQLEPSLAVGAQTEKQPKASRLIRGVLFFAIATFAGAGIGAGWLAPHLAWLGVVGMGLLLLGQLRHPELRYRLLSALVAGCLSFAIANPWMPTTIESVSAGAMTSGKALLISLGVHLFHAGSFCLFAALWWCCSKVLKQGWALAPVAWAAAEAIYPALFPMKQGCLLADVSPLVQTVAVFGASAASVQLVLLAGLLPGSLALCGWFTPRFPQPLLTSIAADRQQLCGLASNKSLATTAILATVAITSCNLAWGVYRLSVFEQQRVSFAGEELNILCLQQDTEYSSFHSDLVEKSQRAADDCGLVIWPECALGTYERTLTSFADSTAVAMHSFGVGHQFRPWPNPRTCLLAGGYSYARKPLDETAVNEFGFAPVEMESKYVSAYLFDTQESTIGRHDKSKLMAGGEYTPGSRWFPALAAWLAPPDEEETAISAGKTPRPIGSVEGLSLGALLCCEDMYPDAARQLSLQGADVLVCMANGMAFDSAVALHQHFIIARFRALENDRYFVRCGSFGRSGLISPVGRIVDTAPLFDPASLELSIPVEKRPMSLFTRFGSALLWIATALIYLTIGPLRKLVQTKIAGTRVVVEESDTATDRSLPRLI